MSDHYSLYTWAMDRQHELQRDAERRRMIREVRAAQSGRPASGTPGRVVSLPVSAARRAPADRPDDSHDKSA